MNDVVAKHQHVPVADWFFTGEAGSDTTVVNLYPSGSGAACFLLFWACTGMAATAIAIRINTVFFICIFFLFINSGRIKNMQYYLKGKCY